MRDSPFFRIEVFLGIFVEEATTLFELQRFFIFQGSIRPNTGGRGELQKNKNKLDY